MKKSKIITILLVLIMTILTMAGCSNQDKEVLNVFNWGQYIDDEVLDMFEEETGIKVNYQEFTTNEDMYTKVAAGAEKYDVLIPSDYMIQRLIEEDRLYELNVDNIPNAVNIMESLRGLSHDAEDKYSVPYMWGTVGILYNKTMVDDVVDSWDILWNPKYQQKILMYDSQRDSFMVSLTRLGYSMNTTNIDEIEEAKQELQKQRDLVLAYVVDEAKDKMISEEAALTMIWSGEAIAAQWENEDLVYVIPKEESNIWVDSMVIPKTSENKEAAEMFINFMARDDISVKNMEWIGYTSANTNVRDMIDEEWAASTTAYPDLEALERLDVFTYNQEIMSVLNNAWIEIFTTN